MWYDPTKHSPVEGEIYRFRVRPAHNISLPTKEHIGLFVSPGGNGQFVCNKTGTSYYLGSNLYTITRYTLLVPHL